MVIKKIPQIGSPLLRRKSKSVEDFNSKEVRQTIRDLVDTMRASNLIAMAAPQIGKNLRIFVAEIRKTKYRRPEEVSKLKVYINPKIIKLSEKKSAGYEGCGSVINAQLFGPVKRPEEVVVGAYDESGKKFQARADGLLGRAIQHEYDHLRGVLFTDKISDWEKIMSSEEYIKTRPRNKDSLKQD